MTSEPLWLHENWTIEGEDEVAEGIATIVIANGEPTGPTYEFVCDVHSQMRETADGTAEFYLGERSRQYATLIASAPALYRALNDLLAGLPAGFYNPDLLEKATEALQLATKDYPE